MIASLKNRCPWAGEEEIYIRYHDEEWGRPLYDDQALFEFLLLEGAQAGLSWLTILKRRDAYRKAYLGFDAERLASFGEREINALLSDSGIIRNRTKILSAINNARCFLKVQREHPGGFSNLIWSIVNGQPRQNSWRTISEVPAITAESAALSKVLKSRGFTFVGPTICYAHMQACGLVNDHLVDCHCFEECSRS